MYLLFTSNMKPLYTRDMLNVSCLPAGAEIQFSYSLNNIPETSRATIADDLEWDKKAVVVFCYAIEAVEPVALDYYPLRMVEILSAELYDGSLLIRFKLGDFFVLGERERLDGLIRSGPHPQVSKESFLVETNIAFKESDFSSDPSCWEQLVFALLDLHQFKGTTFFLLESDDKKLSLELPPNYSDKLGLPEIEIRSGETRMLSAYVVRGKSADKKSYAVPSLAIDEAVASVAGPFIRQKRKGVHVVYAIQASHVLQGKTGTLVFRSGKLAEGESGEGEAGMRVAGLVQDFEEAATPEFQAILQCKPSWNHVMWTIILLVLGVGLNRYAVGRKCFESAAR